MRNLICVVLVVFLPLTLASETQHRFKVHVNVGGDGDNEQAVNTVESHLKRELRLLGDVDVVGREDDWGYIIQVYVLTMKTTDGRLSGGFALGTHEAYRLHESYYKSPEHYKILQATGGGIIGAGYMPRYEDLPMFCINYVSAFDKSKLSLMRSK